MKRLVAYTLVVIALFVGVISTSTSTPIIEPAKSANQISLHQAPVFNHHQSFFSAFDVFQAVGVNSEQIHLANSFQNFSYRVFPSLLNSFRILHTAQITQQKFFSGTTSYLLNSSNKQLDGYYLYHLCKLLI